MRIKGLNGWIAAFAVVFSYSGPVLAEDVECSVLKVPNPYLNAQFCSRLKALGDNRVVPPTRGVTQIDPETEKLVSEVPIIQEAFEADPAKALELIKRIRKAGGLTN